MLMIINYFYIFLVGFTSLLPDPTGTAEEYPSATIANNMITMGLYLPDAEQGFYRGTRFDWAGMISSLDYKGHEYFGEWRSERNPMAPSDVTGPVDGYIKPGLGYEDAKVGEEFVRIGIGALKKIEEQNYSFNTIYEFVDQGTWETRKGKDWIEFKHTLNRPTGWAYVYTKKIEMTEDVPGFTISYNLKNTGSKRIETDQFNHNFFMIDDGITGPGFSLKFPFEVRAAANTRKPLPNVEFTGNELIIKDTVTNRDIWVLLAGYAEEASHNGFEILNKVTGAGVKVRGDKPLHRLVFWATKNTLCPENFIYINVAPGEEYHWSSTYELFLKESVL